MGNLEQSLELTHKFKFIKNERREVLMKTNLKEQKGITLIALIITIVVLLILAVVTISAVNEGSIFAHANNAATRYS